MSAGVSNDALLDLTRTTLTNLPDLEFEVALDFQEYNVINQWFQQDKIQIESGTSIERNILLDTSGNARHVRMFQKTAINIADVQLKITAPWCQVQTYWSVERRELLRNRTPARYVSLIESRRLDGTIDLADLLETRAWLTPTNSTDDLNPRGIPYWIVKRAAADTGQGFDGQTVVFGDATTSTTIGGIDASTAANAKWRNYNFAYQSVNSDFVKRLRRAFHATNFKSPMIAKDMTEKMANYRLYMGLDLLTEYEELTTQQNDNLGKDLDPFHGTTTFRRVPILYTPQIDSDVDRPVYGVNHKKFFPIVLADDWMREDGPHRDVEQHNVQTTFIDGSYQYFSTNRREGGFVGHLPR